MRRETKRPAKKRFGQHFLERAWIAKVVRAIEPLPSDLFLEIGPGRGALTDPLAAAAAHVTAFEIDHELAAHLAISARAEGSRVTVVEGDFLRATLDTVTAALPATVHTRLRLAGNLPYNAASPILFKITELYRQGLPLHDATVMLQREVADRLLAATSTREYGVLTVLIGRHASMRRLLDLPPGAFRPAPKVQSTVVRITFKTADPPARNERTFEALTQAIFTRRRKTLANALRAFAPSDLVRPADVLRTARLDGMRRPETLTIEEVVRLSDAFEA